MTRELVVRTWCDAHAAKGERVVGTVTHDVVWDRLARTLDLCAECDAFLAQPLAVILTEISATAADGEPTGSPAAPKKRGPGRPRSASPQPNTSRPPVPCIVCGYTTPSMSSTYSHLGRNHGLTTVQEAYGLTCPLCGEQKHTSKELAQHIRSAKAHPDHAAGLEAAQVSGIPDGFVFAEQAGDPHGVVAAAYASARERAAAFEGTKEG